MSTQTTYKCDVCRETIKDEAFTNKEAFALKWDTTNTLKPYCPWRDMPFHICVRCVKAIVDFNRLMVNQ